MATRTVVPLWDLDVLQVDWKYSPNRPMSIHDEIFVKRGPTTDCHGEPNVLAY